VRTAKAQPQASGQELVAATRPCSEDAGASASFSERVATSPRMASQRRAIDAIFGGSSQPVQFMHPAFNDFNFWRSPVLDEEGNSSPHPMSPEGQKRRMTAAYGQRLMELLLNTEAGMDDAIPRELRVKEFLDAGGTPAEAERALLAAPVDNAGLSAVLQLLDELRGLAGADALNAAQLVLLAAERGYMTDNDRRHRAIAIITTAPAIETARMRLARLRPFAYVEEFGSHAEQQATLHRQGFEAEHESLITAQADSERVFAVSSVEADALKSLTRKQRADVDKGTNKADGKVKLDNAKLNLAGPAINAANSKEQMRLEELRAVLGPAAYNAKKEDYRAWFSTAGWHPDCVRALVATQEDRPLALTVVNCIQAQATTQTLLLTTGLDVTRLRRCLTLITPLQLATLLAGGVNALAIRDYLESTHRATLLLQLCVAAVPAARIAALAASLVTLNAQITDGVERGHLVTLLANDDPGPLVFLLNAAPDPALGKLALLAAIRPQAQTAADLLACLQLCGRAKWTAAKINTVLGLQPPAGLLDTLLDAIRAEIAIQYTKNGNFMEWLRAVSVLVDEGYMDITLGAWSRLPGLPTTDHLDVTVSYRATGVSLDSFCVHYHPGASSAAVGSPNASKSHVKTDQHAADHIERTLLPAPLQVQLPSRP
jgi:hypothetical protein